ncbi:hypothetical protein Tco_0788046 [Tanacetum coccineum]
MTLNLTVNIINHCLQIQIQYQWLRITVLVAEGSSETTTERYMENYKNVSQDIRDQLNAKAEAVQIILTGIDNDIYSTVDACPNACEMWKAMKGETKMMNELVRNQCHVTNHQVNVQFLLQLQPEWQRMKCNELRTEDLHVLLSTSTYRKQSTRNRGKAIVTSSDPTYDPEPDTNEVNEIRAERLARTANPRLLVAQQQPVYHHQNHPSQNTQYSSTRSQQSTRNKEKMLLCKQEEAGVQLNAEQADWKDDTDDEYEDQELEAHYMYMA